MHLFSPWQNESKLSFAHLAYRKDSKNKDRNEATHTSRATQIAQEGI